MERRSSGRSSAKAAGTPPSPQKKAPQAAATSNKATAQADAPPAVTTPPSSETSSDTAGTRSRDSKDTEVKVEPTTPTKSPKKSTSVETSLGDKEMAAVNLLANMSNPPRAAGKAPEPGPSSSGIGQIVEAPEVSGEEVVLNRRGMPQRQRKKNRFYYDDDMVTSDTPRKTKVKEEPLDEEQVPDSPPSAFPPEIHTPAPTKRSYTKKVYSAPPTAAVQMARAVTQMVRPRLSKVLKRPKGEKVLKVEKSGEHYTQTILRTSTEKSTPTGRHDQRMAKGAPTPTPQERGQRPVGRPSKSEGVPSKVSARYPAAVAVGKIELPQKVKHRHSSHSGKGSLPIKGTRDRDRDRERERERDRDRGDTRDRGEMVAIKIDPDMVVATSSKGDNLYSYSMDDHALRSVMRPERVEKFEREEDYRKVQGREDVLLSMIDESDTEKVTLDKKTAQEISLRLRNLLKLPKAHKWVCYEWFYSNIDKVLFDGENDFQICFKESFPQLKTRKLTRTEWTKLRRLMGKPRRCSYAFFDEEREELAKRRQKIRMIQQRKLTDFNYKELPDEIPLQLVIGTKVTTRLRRPQDGLFTGTIEAVDTSNNTYRITFDRPGLGTHSIPDYEVLSNDPPETVSTSSFALKIPRRSYMGGNQFKLNAALGDEINKYSTSPFPIDGMLGGFPIRLLDMIVRLSKLLKAKRDKILQLKELNVEAEKMKSYNKPYNDDFRTRYARCILDLESMNREMTIYLEGVQQYCLEIAPDHGANQMIIPQQVKEHCDQEAALIVHTCNNKQNRPAVQSDRGLTLMAKLTSLLLQVKTLSPGERNLFELKSIKDSLKEIKASLDGKNLQLFQDKIEIPMNRIQAGLTYRNNPNN